MAQTARERLLKLLGTGGARQAGEALAGRREQVERATGEDRKRKKKKKQK